MLSKDQKSTFFLNFQMFLSYRQITLPINFHGAKYHRKVFFLKLLFLTNANLKKFLIYQNSYSFLSYSLYTSYLLQPSITTFATTYAPRNCIMDYRPDRKNYSLLRDKYFRKDSRISYLHWKSLNMHSECGNIKEGNKYLCAILNIHGHGGQLMINP